MENFAVWHHKGIDIYQFPWWVWWQYVFYSCNIEAALWANADKSGDECWETCVTEYF